MGMDFALTIIFMIVVGAAIGGVTNHLAIKMLFHPYTALYIGKWKVPFTPGLIPKRRDELAVQLGKMVVNHLLTPESIQKKFLTDGFRKEMTSLVQKEVDKFLSSEETPQQFLARFGIEDATDKLEGRFDEFLERKYEELMEKYRHKPIKSILSEELLEKMDTKIPIISQYILQKGSDYFLSVEGELRIARMIDDFVKERNGMLGNMLQMFLGNVNLTEKIQKEVVKFLNSEGTKELVSTLLRKEWEKILEWQSEKLEEQFGREQIVSLIKENAQKIVRIDRILDTPISKLSISVKDIVIEKGAPQIVNVAIDQVANQIGVLMQRLRLAEVVQEQVEAFSVQRIEEMILSIIKSELKWITYLGAILGGAIGLLQGVIVQLFG